MRSWSTGRKGGECGGGWHPSAWERTGTGGQWSRERPGQLTQHPWTSFFSHKQDPKAKKGVPELCVWAPVCWVLCAPFNTVFFFFLRKAKSDSCQPCSEGATVGVAFLEQKGGFYSTHGDLGEGTEPGRESTLAQQGLLNYRGSLLRTPPAPGTTSFLCAACFFLHGGF